MASYQYVYHMDGVSKTYPGGKQVPNQNKAVYDRVAGAKTDETKQENLVTSNEEPVDVVQRTLMPETLPMDDDTMSAATPTGDTIDPRLLPRVVWPVGAAPTPPVTDTPDAALPRQAQEPEASTPGRHGRSRGVRRPDGDRDRRRGGGRARRRRSTLRHSHGEVRT